MRKLYNYQVVRYFPNINSDEFFNVGIHLANDEKNIIHFINDEHLSKTMTFPSIDKKTIVKFIQMLEEEKNINHWYGNNLKFSEKKAFRSSQTFEEILEILYEDYIGYKFHFKEKIDTIELIKENTRNMIKKDFINYVDVNENTIFDFEIIDKKLYKHHYSNLISIGNKENVLNMSWDVTQFLLSNTGKNNTFELLNIKNTTQNIQVANNILHRSNIVEIPYYDEDTRYNYLKQIAGV
ncbi:MAG: DUF3037 domain-containing protein [Campylobacterota bacterium]|nr:DUF3037 domain-containing protein [Campylobacterota bacterium]